MHKFSLFVLYFAPFFFGFASRKLHLHFVNEITIEDRIFNCNLLFWKEKKRLKRNSNFILFSINMSGIFWHLSFGSYNINLTKKYTWVLSNSFFWQSFLSQKAIWILLHSIYVLKKSFPQAQLADSRYPTIYVLASQKIR